MRGASSVTRALCAAAVVVFGLSIGTARQSFAQTPVPTPVPTTAPTPGGDCCAVHNGPGCDLSDCQQCVCGSDPVCCSSSPDADGWDAICVADTMDPTNGCNTICPCAQTPVPTPTPGGPCCNPHEGGGCDISACQACVCGEDPHCCGINFTCDPDGFCWDATCVLEASTDCSASCPCQPPPTATPTPVATPGGDCCAAHGGPSCDDSTCSSCVCNIDHECCNNLWDQTCTDEASVECSDSCPCAGTGDCCSPHDPAPGCNETSCKACVCGIDDPCCTDGQGWDADCVSEANVECAAACPCAPKGPCCDAHPDTVGCDENRCQLCVCAIDATCCNQGWDGTCASEAANECHERCTGCGVSDCCSAQTTPGCSTDACKSCVCGIDSFCCDQMWDSGCVDIASGTDCGTTCACGGGGSCTGDCNGDGQVTVNDLIIAVNVALGNAPVSQCTAIDTNGDGQVSVNELIQAVNSALNGCTG